MTAFAADLPPDWALKRPKPILQSTFDLLGAPLRMAAFPDAVSERLHLTSLRAERFAAVLPRLKGRVLDIGAGDNTLCRLYRQNATLLGADPEDAASSVGVDVVDWNGQSVIIEDAASLPFPDQSFDTVCFIACINHIVNRVEALREARRVLRPGGRVIVTMIGRFIGTIGHAIWWYSEDKHRDVDHEEAMGLDDREVKMMLRQAGFEDLATESFVYGLNRLYVARVG